MFSLQRAPPIKFYVTGYAALRLHSSLRSYTVGVSHVAHANTSEGVMASLACTDMASEHKYRKVKHESHGDAIDMEMSTFEIIDMPER